MQARRRLVKDVEGAPGRAARQLLGELDPLRFAAGQRRRLLADLHVAQANALERLHLVADRRHRLEQVRRLLDRHVEHVGDRPVPVAHLERLAIVALALAHVAGDVDIRQKVHLDLDHAIALAGLAPAALDVEREPPWQIAARLGLRQAGEPVADGSEGAGIGGRIGARSAADRRLVDVDHLVDLVEAVDAVVRRRRVARAVQAARGGLVERVDNQRRFAAARDAGDAGEEPKRNRRRHIFQVVAARADDGELAAGVGGAAARRDRDRPLAGQELAGQRIRIGGDLGRRSPGDDLAAMYAGAGADVDDIIGGPDRVLVVLDHDHRIAEPAQAAQRVEEPRIVALVEADRRLVEHIEHAGEAGADLRSEPDALALAARQRARRAR